MSYDVLVLGAGVAGATAAAILSRGGKRVALLEGANRRTRPCCSPEWINAHALSMLHDLGIGTDRFLGEPFAGAMFHTPDLARSAVAPAKEPPAYRLNYEALANSLIARATELNTERLVGPCELECREDQVSGIVNGEPVRGSLMLTACGAQGEGRWVCQRIVPVRKRPADEWLHWVIGMENDSLAAWWLDDDHLVVTCWGSGPAKRATTQTTRLVQQIAEHKLAGEMSMSQAVTATWPQPARPAIEFDSHVTKRCLTIGDAGGFVAAASREGVYPAMWSARLATEVVLRALEHDQPQDVLRDFNQVWRSSMAAYMQSSHTDSKFLLPLVFGNSQMAAKLANCFWHGQSL